MARYLIIADRHQRALRLLSEHLNHIDNEQKSMAIDLIIIALRTVGLTFPQIKTLLEIELNEYLLVNTIQKRYQRIIQEGMMFCQKNKIKVSLENATARFSD